MSFNLSEAATSKVKIFKGRSSISYRAFFISTLLLVFLTVTSQSYFGSVLSQKPAYAQSAPTPSIWPTVQHDFLRSGDGNYSGPSSNSTDWIFGPFGPMSSSPVIGPTGTIYVVDNSFHLFALNPDGSIEWEKVFNEGLFSPAIGPSGTIYVPGTRHLYAFTPAGDPVWTVPYNISTSRSSALVISPQGILFEVNSSGWLSAIDPFGTVATQLWALNAQCIPATLAMGPSGSLYCGTTSNNSSPAFDSISSNGQLQWSYPMGSIVLLAPTITSYGTIFVVSSGGEIYALNEDGAILYTVLDIHQETVSAVLGPGGLLYVAGIYQSQYRLIALSQTGLILQWSEICYQAPNSLCYPFNSITSLEVDSAGTLYVGTNSSGLIAINSNGGLVWAYTEIPPGEGSLSPMAIGANGTMYVGTSCIICNSTSTYGHLLAIGQPDGYSSFTVEESGLPAGNPWSFIVDGENYTTPAASLDFSLPNGSFSWESPATPLPGTLGVRYASTTLSGNFSVPGTSNLSLSYSIEYQLNFSSYPPAGGSILPASGLWYTPGSIVLLNATATAGYNFGVWSTSYGLVSANSTTSANSAIVVNGPGDITGEFDPLVTLTAGPQGSVSYLDPPYVGTLQPGQSISIYAPSVSVLVLTAKPLAGYVFQSWNSSSFVGIDATSSVLQIRISSPVNLTARFASAPTISTGITSSTTAGSSTPSNNNTSSTSSTVEIVSVPTTSKLPTQNLALDFALAVIVALAILLGIAFVTGLASTKRNSP